MKTKYVSYAKQQGEKPFNWNRFLERAGAGNLKPSDWGRAVSLAKNWVTCACGNQCSALPRSCDNSPEDEELYNLGVGFTMHINDRSHKKAKAVLELIELRSAFLLRKMELDGTVLK